MRQFHVRATLVKGGIAFLMGSYDTELEATGTVAYLEQTAPELQDIYIVNQAEEERDWNRFNDGKTGDGYLYEPWD